MTKKLILVTGGTGYIASRLIPRLLEQGYLVRTMARRPEQLAARAWRDRVELLYGDLTIPGTLAAALGGVHTAYYLIHNMTIGRGYAYIEAEAAHHFAFAARGAGVEHIIYLGGLADPNDRHLAPHLRSRLETGEVLRRGGVPVTEFRTGVIAGPGSISFEMIRFMTEALPLTIGPTWLKNKAQPIATENVIDYLTAALENFNRQNRIFEIGGREVASYGDLMLRYAALRGLKRRLILLPGLPLWFMALGVAMLTPVPRRIAYALLGGLAGDSIVQDDEARRVFPNVKLSSFDEATTNALRNLSPASLERIWEGSVRDRASLKHEGFFVDYRRAEIRASPAAVYRAVASLGGPRGWLYADWLWQLRGWVDGLIPPPNSFPGGRRTRPEGEELKPGDALDYYRVESIELNRLLRLYSELRAPGDGWMEWQIAAKPGPGRLPGAGEAEAAESVLTQTAFFAPRGLPGFLYWHLLDPIHRLVFRGLIQAIKRQSEIR